MLKVIAILAAIVAATSSYAQEVRVFSGSIEHVYGPGGQLRDSPELRARNQRAERQMREEEWDGPNFDRQRTITIETSRRQTPRSWWNQAPAAAEELVGRFQLGLVSSPPAPGVLGLERMAWSAIASVTGAA